VRKFLPKDATVTENFCLLVKKNGSHIDIFFLELYLMLHQAILTKGINVNFGR
jgi:hypothetical protein